MISTWAENFPIKQQKGIKKYIMASPRIHIMSINPEKLSVYTFHEFFSMISQPRGMVSALFLRILRKGKAMDDKIFHNPRIPPLFTVSPVLFRTEHFTVR